MYKKSIFLFLLLFTFANSEAQSEIHLKEINQVWEKFYNAFDSLDANLMAEIHSKKLIRISGGKHIKNYQEYIRGYKANFDKAKKNSVTNKISLRFFERINNDSIGSERGIYKLTKLTNRENKQTFYGKFHVLLTKEDGNWKILMDYDSDENNSIGEKEYLSAHGINELEHFIQK